MDVSQIKGLGKELNRFMREFDDCFGRSEPRRSLRTYVRGQLSNLRHKAIEPIALDAGVPPRTLQYFFSSAKGDDALLRDRTQQMVARDHGHAWAIGVIDETGNPKQGRDTAAVQKQYCGNTGKVDNCVVAVHWAYVAGDFVCLMDSDLFLPESWANDWERRHKADIPDDVIHRKKTVMALEQVARALRNGLRLAGWSFDALYGHDREFLDGMDALGQNYCGQIPSDFFGWLRPPRVLVKPVGGGGRKRRFPRLARKALPACAVANLMRYSERFSRQKGKRYRVTDTERGPMVWEVKVRRFYRKHGAAGLPGAAHTLIVARNVLDPKEIKYFLSNQVPAPDGVTVEWLLSVAFSRFGVERCFELGKRDLGLDHFEMRSWRGIHRHLYISQLSLLFCARVHHRLREKNDRFAVSDRRGSASGRQRLAAGQLPPAAVSGGDLPEGDGHHRLPPEAQPGRPPEPSQNHLAAAAPIGHPTRFPEIMCAP
jgi:SRSO17 transposase